MSSTPARLLAQPYLGTPPSRSPSPSSSSLSSGTNRSISSASSYISTTSTSPPSSTSSISVPAGDEETTRPDPSSSASTRSTRGTRRIGLNATAFRSPVVLDERGRPDRAADAGAEDDGENLRYKDDAVELAEQDEDERINVHAEVIDRPTSDGLIDQKEDQEDSPESESEGAAEFHERTNWTDHADDSLVSVDGEADSNSEQTLNEVVVEYIDRPGTPSRFGTNGSPIIITSSASNMSSPAIFPTPTAPSRSPSGSRPQSDVRRTGRRRLSRFPRARSGRDRDGSLTRQGGSRQQRMMIGEAGQGLREDVVESGLNHSHSYGGMVVLVEMDENESQQQQEGPAATEWQAPSSCKSGGGRPELVTSLLPHCEVSLAFADADGGDEVPPCFHTGDNIPVLITLVVKAPTKISFLLAPQAKLTLVGTLKIGSVAPETVLMVPYPVDELLASFAKRARGIKHSAAGSPSDEDIDEVHAGVYSARAQLPIPQQLEPTINMPHGRFSLKYALSLSLTCKDPMTLLLDPHHPAAMSRMEVARCNKLLTVLNTIRPTGTTRFDDLQVVHRCSPAPNAPASHRILDKAVSSSANKEPEVSWIFFPVLPTTTFSTTSVIPVTLSFTARNAPSTTILIRLTLVHRQLVRAEAGTQSAAKMTFVDTDICTRAGMFRLPGEGTTVLGDMILPLQDVQPWKYGASAELCHPWKATPETRQIIISNTFFVQVETFWTERSWNEVYPMVVPPGLLSQPNKLSLFFVDHKRKDLHRKFPGHCHVVEIPIEIGSVGESQDAMREYRWSDVVERPSGGFSMIRGTAFSSEAGWNVAPPSYRDACSLPPMDPAGRLAHMQSRQVRVLNFPRQNTGAGSSRV